MPGLSIVLPTYKESVNIAAMLPELRAAFKGEDVELVVVDDNSPDGTGDVARKVDAKAKVIVRTTERGLATAVVRGFNEASGDWVLVMDCDFQHPVTAVKRMWERAQKGDVDMVVGSRYAPGGGGDGVFTTGRKIMSRGARLLAKVALPPVRRNKLTDPMSGLFLVRRAKVVGAPLQPSGYKILLEVIGRVPLQGIAEVGYTFEARRAGDSKLGSKVFFQYLAHLGKLGAGHPGNRWIWFLLALVVVGSAVLVFA